MTLEDLHNLAVLWCPKKARWDNIFVVDHWGPAHELGHALIETRDRWKKESYGRCSLSSCKCYLQRCVVYEAAAMTISRGLLKNVGREDLADDELQATDDYDFIEEEHYRRAMRLLRDKNVWPMPKKLPQLERLLRVRLVKPRGASPRKSLTQRVSDELNWLSSR